MKTFVGTISALIALLFISSGFVPAGTADQILEESKTKFESLGDLAAEFSYTLANPSLKPIVKEGNLKYKKGMYVVSLPDQAFYCDKETIWIHLMEDAEVNILDYDPDEGMNIEAIFQLYEASAEARMDGEETVHGVKCYKIFLAIKDANLDYNRGTVWINKKTKLLEKATLIDRRQTETTFELSSIKTNNGFGTSTFQMDLTKLDVDVYDER